MPPSVIVGGFSVIQVLGYLWNNPRLLGRSIASDRNPPVPTNESKTWRTYYIPSSLDRKLSMTVRIIKGERTCTRGVIPTETAIVVLAQ
jgi:hypothetical protein